MGRSSLPQRLSGIRNATFREITFWKSALWIAAVGATGVGIGMLAGFLFAPRSGEETRGLISDSVNRVGDGLQTAASSAVDKVAVAGSSTQATVQNLAARFRR